MTLLIQIAWRNLWRNPKRSMLLISAIVVCIASLIITLAWINGMLNQMVQNSIEFHIGEMEIYQKGFREDNDPSNYISDETQLLSYLESNKNVRASAPRVEGRGLVSSSYSSSGVQITGIDAEKEGDITLVKRSVIGGRYLDSSEGHDILIGRKMADKLQVGIGDKVVLTVQTIRKELASDAFRIVGIYSTISNDFDKYMVYIPIERSRSILGLEKGITGLALRIDDEETLEEVKADVNRKFGKNGMEALTWGDLEPLLKDMVDISKQWTLLFFLAVFIVLSIGIINTQNIAVYERMHELGVLKAMGTKPLFIFSMIMLETCFLAILGLSAGLIITYPLIFYFSTEGLNLAIFAEGLQLWGMGSRIYLDLGVIDIVYSSISVIITAFFGALLPSIRASRLEPVKAIRYV